MRLFQPRTPRNYQEQTYSSPYWIVRYPHQMRLRAASEAVLDHHPEVLLDYGAGDGHLLFTLVDAGFAGDIVAYEPDAQFRAQLDAEARRRGLQDRIAITAQRSDLLGPYDFVCCLGVLEHMPLPERRSFYDLCRGALAPGGRVLIDVPVEVGPTLLVKSLIRMVLKGRYKEYRWSEILRYGLGGRIYDASRYDKDDTRTWVHDHKGFDYRLLERELIEDGFTIVARRPTPFRRLPAPLFNQEVFLTLSR